MSEQVAEKKKAIFDSTLELVKEHGFHGCTMSLLAKEAKVAAGTIYHYFESKDQLICELFMYVTDQLVAATIDEDSAAKSYKERFFSLLHNLHRFHMENPNVLIFFGQFMSSPYRIQHHNTGFTRFDDVLYDFFKEGVTQGHIKQMDAKLLSSFVNASIISTVRVRQALWMSFNEAELDQIVHVLWDGIVKK